MIALACGVVAVALAVFGLSLCLAWRGEASRAIGAFHACGVLILVAFFVAGLS